MNTRILEVRKNAGLTQEEFAKEISLSKNYVWMMEKGERIPSDRTILEICRKFNVSLEWLTTGEGDMYTSLPDDVLDNLVSVYRLNEMDKKIISAYLNLSESEREIIKKYILSIQGFQKNEKPAD